MLDAGCRRKKEGEGEEEGYLRKRNYNLSSLRLIHREYIAANDRLNKETAIVRGSFYRRVNVKILTEDIILVRREI